MSRFSNQSFHTSCAYAFHCSASAWVGKTFASSEYPSALPIDLFMAPRSFAGQCFLPASIRSHRIVSWSCADTRFDSLIHW